MNALDAVQPVQQPLRILFRGNAPYPRERSLMPIEEARTRLRHYSPDTGRSLFPSSRNHMETVHPRALEIIELAREKDPLKVFWITSNEPISTSPRWRGWRDWRCR
ncbi:MAG: hypothetical protein MZW92_60240 [Comamonadaceae bacterium]|nr:hypothetical protein [Comamonadaceae bacterium]